MNEKMLCTEIVQSLNKIPATFAWKIPDSSPRLRKIQPFIPARAFDILCCHSGAFIAFEVKHMKGPYSLSIKRFTDFEKRCLLAVESSEGAAYAAIGWWFYPTQYQMNKYNMGNRVKSLTLIRASVLFNELSSGSVTYRRLLELGRTVEYKRWWDLREFLSFYPAREAKWAEFRVMEDS